MGVPIMPACTQACSASAAWHAHVHGRSHNSQQRALLPMWLVRNRGMGRGCVIVLVDGMIALEYSPTCIFRLLIHERYRPHPPVTLRRRSKEQIGAW